jgi:hypothetical protein
MDSNICSSAWETMGSGLLNISPPQKTKQPSRKTQIVQESNSKV